MNFLSFKFDSFLIETYLLLKQFSKAIKEIMIILKKKSSNTNKKLQSLINLLSFAIEVIF